MIPTLTAALLGKLTGGTAALLPPREEQPPNSLRAKALHALWWALRPYLGSSIPSAKSEHISSEEVKVETAGGQPQVVAVVSFNRRTRALVLSFAGQASAALASALEGPEGVPFPCLEASAPEAQVNSGYLAELRRLLGADKKAEEGPLSQAVSRVLGQGTGAKLEPASILCTGYGLGGGLAQLAVVRLALKFPSADTTCITFGSPNIGNQKFAEAFSMLVGQSFRVVHEAAPSMQASAGGASQPGEQPHVDALTLKPEGGSWTCPVTCDVIVGGKAKLAPGSIGLADYVKALLHPVFAHGEWLPRNKPGIYLMLQPETLKKARKPWPVDPCFVPEPGKHCANLPSPFDAGVDLGGVRLTVSQLFDQLSPAWAGTLKELGIDSGGEEPKAAPAEAAPAEQEATGTGSRGEERAESSGQRFNQHQKPRLWPAPFGAGKLANKATKKNKEAAKSKDEETGALEYLDYQPLADLAGQERIFDKLSAHRLPLPLLLAQAVYRTSRTGLREQDPMKVDDGTGFQSDPFGGAIRGLVGKGLVLGYRLIDDCKFERLKDAQTGEWTPISKDQKQEDNRTDTQAYVLWMKDGTAIFAFRGTTGAADWATNSDRDLKDLGDTVVERNRGSIHQGFMRGFCAVAHRGYRDESKDGDYKQGDLFARNLAGALQELMQEHPLKDVGPARVMCVGHSLGGALATIAAAWAAEQYPLAPVSLYTFGQPRVGDDKFIRHLDQTIGTSVRCVHRLDPVPLVPLNHRLVPPLAARYFHHFPAGYLRCSYVSDRLLAPLSRLLGDDCDFQLARRVDMRLPLTFLMSWPFLGDHYMNNYHEQFKRAMGKLGATLVPPRQTEGEPPAGPQ